MIAAFTLAWRRLVRGRTLPLLLLAAALLAWFLPGLLRSDGSATGLHEMYLRAILGSIAAVTALTVLCGACGVLADEREGRRLALAVVRPLSAFRMVLGVWLAHVAMAALVLAFAGGIAWACVPGGRPDCRHYVAPALPPPEETAAAMLASYLADPATPPAVKKAPRSAVFALLVAKEADRYESVPPGERLAWPFPAGLTESGQLAVRVRFATQFESRTPFSGVFTYGPYSAVVSNCTQAVLVVPLVRRGTNAVAGTELAFANTGRETVMLRPRQDLAILQPADGFLANLVRALLQTWATVAFAAAFGLFLSSALSRPVAVFTALVATMVVLMAPDVIAQYPDALDTTWTDRLGLSVSRGVYALTATLSNATPLADLAEGRCVEARLLARAVSGHGLGLPLVLLLASALIVRRKALPE